MKFTRKRIPALLLAVLFVFLTATTALAQEAPDLTKKCSFTVTMRNGSKAVKGGTLSIYRVGEVAMEDADYIFQPTGSFKDCGEDFTDLTDSKLASRLKKYADKNEIAALKTKTINKYGKVTFDNLTAGLYLVVQKKAASGYSAIDPFLISLPYFENGVYKYDLTAEPKTELEPEEKETTKPPDVPQTGQLWWPVPMLVCGGLVLVSIGYSLTRRKKFDEG